MPDLGPAAAAAGLLDVAYATLDSPVGTLLLARTPRGLVRVAYVDFGGEDEVLSELAARVSPRVIAHAPRAGRVRARARRVLRRRPPGVRSGARLAADARGFGRRVLEATAAVPYGSVSTYKQVAAQAGNERASRAAGNALGANPLPIVVPCHRILHSTRRAGRIHRRPRAQTRSCWRSKPARRARLSLTGRGWSRSPRYFAFSRPPSCGHTAVMSKRALRSQLPPGPRVPAAVQLLAFWKRPASSLERQRRRYGKRFTVQVPFQPPFVMLSDPAELKEVFTAPPEVLHPGEGARVLEPVIGRNSVILLDEGPHLEQRKLMLPAFHGERMQRLYGLMTELTERELDSWPTEEPVALHPRLQRLTLEIILRAVFGLEQGQRLEELRDALTKVLAFSESPLSVLPALRRSPASGPMRDYEQLARRADELIFEQIEERRAAAQSDRDDVLAMLLQARHEDDSPMSAQELRDELMTALVAGHETTASQLAWAFERLAREPAARSRLAAEIDAGEGDEYLTATIHEILRLKPVLPNAEPRLVKQPVTIGGFRYPRSRAGGERLPGPPRPGDLSRALCVPARALPRPGSGHLHVDPLRWRAPALPGRELRAPGDEDRAPRGAGALRAGAGRPPRSRRAAAASPSVRPVAPP